MENVAKSNPTPQQPQKPPRLPWWQKIFDVPQSEKIFFVRHLGVMLKAGISLSKALKTISEQTKNKKMAFILSDIASRTDQGQSLAKSLGLHPTVFDELFVNMIQAGEVSGKYEEVLAELFQNMKKSHELKGKIKGAMIYPIIVIIAMIIIGVAMMLFVIPKLTSIFAEVNVELPLPTQILIAISNSVLQYGLWIGLGLIIIIGGAIMLFRQERPKFYLHAFLLKLPIFGTIIKKINIARFARTLSSLLKTDIPIIESLRITSRVVNNRLYRYALVDSTQNIKKGQTIESALKQRPRLFSGLITQMVLVGEETGSLDDILNELADFYEDEVQQIMDNLPSIIEPILMIILGVGVGGMAVALIMPLYSITQAI